MIRTATRSIIASVQHPQAVRYWPVRQNPRDPVRAINLVTRDAELPVALREACGGPFPTTVTVDLADLGPETLLSRRLDWRRFFDCAPREADAPPRTEAADVLASGIREISTVRQYGCAAMRARRLDLKMLAHTSNCTMQPRAAPAREVGGSRPAQRFGMSAEIRRNSAISSSEKSMPSSCPSESARSM